MRKRCDIQENGSYLMEPLPVKRLTSCQRCVAACTSGGQTMAPRDKPQPLGAGAGKTSVVGVSTPLSTGDIPNCGGTHPAASLNYWLLLESMKVNSCPPASPFFVMMFITPLAASVPYSVAAAGPLSTSMLSISSGAMSLNRP